MCVVSAIGDNYRKSRPWGDYLAPNTGGFQFLPTVTREEFDDLKAEVEALKELLKAAKAFDAATGQPDCEVDEKVEFLKGLADLLGVDLSEVFG